MPWWIRVKGNANAQEEQNPRDSPNWLGILLIAPLVAGVLAMIATWFLVPYLPIPDDDYIDLGLFLFLFIVLFDLIMIGFAARIRWFLLGLLAAPVVGSLPLLWRYLTASMPWVQDTPVIIILWLAVGNLWISQRAAQGDHRASKGGLIAASGYLLTGALSLFLAVVRFSEGKAWLGALSLTPGLLFGFLAAKTLGRIWKRRRARPPGHIV